MATHEEKQEAERTAAREKENNEHNRREAEKYYRVSHNVKHKRDAATERLLQVAREYTAGRVTQHELALAAREQGAWAEAFETLENNWV